MWLWLKLLDPHEASRQQDTRPWPAFSNNPASKLQICQATRHQQVFSVLLGLVNTHTQSGCPQVCEAVPGRQRGLTFSEDQAALPQVVSRVPWWRSSAWPTSRPVLKGRSILWCQATPPVTVLAPAKC